MSRLLSKLNPQQCEAVECINGPLLVLAGAGTGKTRVITCRIAYMLENGVAPESILGMTFTNKAAREMRERLATLIGEEPASKVFLGTFHSFCARLLRSEIHFAGNYNSRFTIADDSDQRGLLRQAAADLGYTKEDAPVDAAASFISLAKNKLQWPPEALASAYADYPAKMPLAEIYERYQKILELQNTLDFDDLLLLTLKILETRPEVLERYREKYKYILVDEYQDTNLAQFRMLQFLAGKAMNICAVGDDDQSIYGWRGAQVSNILDFPSHFPGGKEVKLEQNYRSTNSILEAANAIISKNGRRFSKSLWSARGQGERISIIPTPTGEDEAKFVVDCMQGLLSQNPDMCLSDFAVLYRSNYLSRQFEQEFRNHGIRPRIIGGHEFFQRKEVKDAAAYLKLLVNPRDDQSLLRIISVPPRGIGDKAIETLREFQKVSRLPLSEILGDPEYHSRLSSSAGASARHLAQTLSDYRKEFISEPGGLSHRAASFLEDIGYINGLQRIYKDREESEKRRENVLEFINFMAQFEAWSHEPPQLSDFIERYSLMDDNDRTEDDEDRDAPILTTVHAAKGLEFSCVFIVGVEQNLFPHERALAENGEDEERRLFYVAVTRAKERLFISHASSRLKYGYPVQQMPSKFLSDLPKEFAETSKPEEFFPNANEDDLRHAFEDILRQLKD